MERLVLIYCSHKHKLHYPTVEIYFHSCICGLRTRNTNYSGLITNYILGDDI